MGYEDHIEKLFSQDVLTEDWDGRIRLTKSFIDSVDEHQDEVERSKQERRSLVDDIVADEVSVQRVLSLACKHDSFLGYLLALSSNTENSVDGEWLQTAAILSQLAQPRPRSEGSPRAFFPILGDWLDIFMDLFPNAIVYVWREDCDPCDVMKEKFDEIFGEPPDDLALFAIYGPDYARFLEEEYDITGGPATLFMLDGEVDVRLYGAQYRAVIDNEIGMLRDLAHG